MTTVAELVAQVPAPSRGVVTTFQYGSGVWRFVMELADPSKGSAVQWHDITAITDPIPFTGYDFTRGAENYLGRYRASVATLDLLRHDDKLAPWYPDTSEFFGSHIDLGPGLLLRAGFIRVDGGVVQQWIPRFTNKVSSWGDDSRSQGKVRQHRVMARDMLTSLVNVPLPARPAENWSDRMFHFLVDSGWPYGSAIYGAQFTWDGNPILTLPARGEIASAASELDAICDPTGLTWYTNRLGQLVMRPRVDDTFHQAAFNAGATGDQWPGDVNPVDFAWYACLPPDDPGEPTLAAAYAMDTPSIAPFGFDKDEANVQNHVRITVAGISPAPPDIFDDDDPISIQRYDRKTYHADWVASNDVVAEQILSTRANAVAVARPLHTTDELTNFFPGPANLDYLGYVSIQHRNNDRGGDAFGNGWLRYYREQVRPHGCDIEWAMTFSVDLYSIGGSVAQEMRPVENLGIYGVSDWEAEFRWNNPPQTIEPTHTQVRILSGASIWQTIEYPAPAQYFWGGLSPSTAYEFQVRLIRIEDGVLTDFSPLRSVNFTTLSPVLPELDLEDGELNLPIPGADCEMYWKIEKSNDGGVTWTLYAEDTVSTPPFVIPIDIDALDPAYSYRPTTEEFCSLVPQGIKVGNPKYPACHTVARLGVVPYSDPSLVAYIPMACPKFVDEALSLQPVTAGNASDGWDFVSGVPVMWSNPTHQGVVGYGAEPEPVPGTQDLTIGCRFKLGMLPSSERILWAYAGLLISITAAGRLRGIAFESGAGETFIQGASTLAAGTVYDVTLTHDADVGDLKLYIGTSVEAQALGSVGARVDPFGYTIGLPANSWITDCAVWDKVLAPTAGGTLPDFDTSQTFTYTGGIQHFTVPAGVTLLKITAEGSKGGGSQGGNGERIIAIHPATPLEVLDLYVGGVQWPNGGNAGSAGAFGGSAGAGSTDIRSPGGTFINAWLVAAAGGAMGESSASNPTPFGGFGGHLLGGNSNANTAHGATSTAGGTGGPGGDGSFGQGGHALGSGNSFDFGSGGGGGGWYGGEGGRSGSPPAQSGGGGGSGHVDALCTNVETFDGVVTTTGKIKIEWEGVGLTVAQHPSQADPTSTTPIQFVATFTKPVTGFGPSDVILTGTASAGCAVAVGGTGATYTISITGMTTAGTIIVSIPADVAHSATGAPNSASVSTDNTVTWSGAPVPTQIVGEFILPQNLAGVDPFLSGPMMAGRTMYTIQQSGTPEVWAFDLDAPGTNGGPAALSSRVTITGGTLFAGHRTTGVATGGWLWGLISGPYRIARINVATGAVSGTAAVAYSNHTLGTDSWVYNSDGTNFITRIDPSSVTVVATSPNLAPAGFMAFDAANNALWSMSWTGTGGANDRKLTRLNPLTLAIVGTPINLPAGTGKQLVPIVDQTGTYIYAVDGGNGTIYRVTIATMAVTTFPSVIAVTVANEGCPGAVVGGQMYVWHKYTLETTEAVLAKVNLATMTATTITGYDDPYFGGYEGSHWDGNNLWILGRNVRSGNQSDALIKLGP